MRMSISTWVYDKLPVETAMTKLAAAGFRILEVYSDLIHTDPRSFPENRLKEVREVADSLDLTLRTMHSPYTDLDLLSTDSSKREEAVMWACRSLEYSRKLGCEFMVLHLGARESAEVNRTLKAIRKRALEVMKRISRKAEDLGVKILLENLTQREKRRYSSHIEDLIEVIVNTNPDSVRICMDTSHTIISGLDLYQELGRAASLLDSLHISEPDGERDSHDLPLKRGVVNWEKFYEKLKEVGYNGPFNLEVYGGNDPDSIVEGAKTLPKELTFLEC